MLVDNNNQNRKNTLDGYGATKTCKVTTNDGKALHVEVSGNPDATPALFLHGGPGASIGQSYQWPFSNLNYYLIAFDQRGCGRSQPFASLDNNNINAIVDDIETIRVQLGIEKWVLFGGSWGSTLALVYAIKHPSRVSGLILRGIFLGRSQDADWFISPKGGAAQVFHKEYQAFLGNYTYLSTQSLCEQFYDALLNPKEDVRREAAKRWFNWEGRISRLTESPEQASDFATWQQVYTLALFECHYLLHHCFLAQNYILSNIKNIQHIPAFIVHGRYDMVCKAESAYTLHQHLPKSNLSIIEDAGHSMLEKGISKALVEALCKMQERLVE